MTIPLSGQREKKNATSLKKFLEIFALALTQKAILSWQYFFLHTCICLLLLTEDVYQRTIEKLFERNLWRSFSPSSYFILWVSPTPAPISCGLSGHLLRISQGGDLHSLSQ